MGGISLSSRPASSKHFPPPSEPEASKLPSAWCPPPKGAQIPTMSWAPYSVPPPITIVTQGMTRPAYSAPWSP